MYEYKTSGSGVDTIGGNITGILEKINETVSNIHSGEYKLHDTYVLLNVGEDTTIRKENISYHLFERVSADTLIGYNIACLTPDNEQIYNGTSLYENAYKKLTVVDAAKFPAQIKRYSSSMAFMPFMQEANNMMQNYKTHNNPIALIGYEVVEGEKCLKVQLGKTTDPSYVQYCISTVSYLPIKSTIILTHINNNAIRIQTFNDWVTDVKLNTEIGDDRFSKSALSAYNKEEHFTEEIDRPSKLLPLGSIAPDWQLPTLNNKSIKLSKLANKIVIMDFWFKACVPCQQQMIDLEKLYTRYDKSDVVFVGVNTVDDPIKDKLNLFLSNRKITMPSVYNGKKIESLYRAYSCPVLYIINKDGKILYSQDGFSETMVNDVSKIIEQHL
ncbi:MAG: TlpA disulfide reductase family protein [Mucilaginibacter sp.]|uniref:TlpA family protein disulfide reductase n=1 Tax=Mucilaginibacter sp. TaxID=1882438 RepID=UPI0032653838